MRTVILASVLILMFGCGGNSSTTAPQPAATAREVHVTHDDVQALLTGAGGTDMTPVEEGGKQVGMKLIGAGPGTTAAKLGAATGDIIYSIAGHPLDSIAAAYRAGDLAARESRIEIRGSRAGAPYTLVLVVDP
jgi:hypothetical protein